MKKSNLHFYLFLSVIFAGTILNGNAISEYTPGRSEISPKFWFDVNFYNGSQNHTQLELYYSIPSSELTFINTSNNNIASISISLIVTNSKNEIVLSNSKNKKLRVNSFDETKNDKNGIIDQMIIDLLPGDYNLEIKITDENSKSESKISTLLKVPSFNTTLDISTIQFASVISSAKNNKSFLKGNKSVIPNPSRKYSLKESFLYIYYEVYNLEISQTTNKYVFNSSLLIGGQFNDSLVYLPMQSIVLAGNSCMQTKTIDIRDLKPGNYWITISVTDITSGKIINKKNKFTIYDPSFDKESLPMTETDIEKYRDQIKYFATRNEMELFDRLNIKGKRNFLINFWHSKDTSPETPENEFMQNSFTRINYANTNFKNGLNSDRGRVFVIYGKPDEIENRQMNMSTRPYIIWDYFTTGSGKQRFVFVDVSRNDLFLLVHSTVETEIYNPNWMKENIQF